MLKTQLDVDPIYFFIDKIDKHIKSLYEESTQFNIKNRVCIEQMYEGKIKWTIDNVGYKILRIGIQTTDHQLPLSWIIFCLYQLSIGCGINSDDWNSNFIDEITIQNFKIGKTNCMSAYFTMNY